MEENCLFVFFKQNIYSILVPQGFFVFFFCKDTVLFEQPLHIYIYVYKIYVCAYIYKLKQSCKLVSLVVALPAS